MVGNPWIQTGAITAVLAGVYFGVRALPGGECAFLHVDTIVNADGDTEFCGVDEAVFINMDALRFPVTATLDLLGEPTVGEELHCEVSLKDYQGEPLAWEDLAIVHEERIHLLVTDPSLQDYQHVHPTEVGPGRFAFSFTPRRSGDYRLYLECVPVRTLKKVLAEMAVEVPGDSRGELRQGTTLAARSGVYMFELTFPMGMPQPGQPTDLVLEVRGEAGESIPFVKVMGSYAHMVAFDAAGRGFAHMHPLDEGIGMQSDHPRFSFLLNLDRPGQYRLWAQVNIGGEDRFVPFDLEVPEVLARAN